MLGVTQQAYNNITLHNGYAYAATDYCGMEILDISDPSNLERVGWWNPWDCGSGGNAWINSPGHTNEIQLRSDFNGEFIFMNANDQDMVVVNVNDKNNPNLDTTFGMLGDNIRTWGFGMKGDQIIAAYYFTLLPWLSLESKLVQLSISYIIGSTDNPKTDKIILKPNPIFSGDFVSIQSEVPIHQIQEIDALGKEISNQKIDHLDENIKVKIPALPGLYYLLIHNAVYKTTKRLVVH